MPALAFRRSRKAKSGNAPAFACRKRCGTSCAASHATDSFARVTRHSNCASIDDTGPVVAKLHDIFHARASGHSAIRMAVDNATRRPVLLIGPEKKIRLTMSCPMRAGHNFDKLLRALDAVQLNATHRSLRRSIGVRERTRSFRHPSRMKPPEPSTPGVWKTLKSNLRVVRQPE